MYPGHHRVLNKSDNLIWCAEMMRYGRETKDGIVNEKDSRMMECLLWFDMEINPQSLLHPASCTRRD